MRFAIAQTTTRYTRLCLSCLLVWLLPVPMLGIDRDRRLEQLYHTGWTLMDGVPGEVHALAQTTDGYLWLGTAAGLFRFDGIRFQQYEAPSGQAFSQRNVFSLFATQDGGLWVGFWYGGVSFLKDGKVTNYGEQNGLPSRPILAFARDRQGMIWAAAGTDGLTMLEGSQWKKIGTDWNFTGTATTVFMDHTGTLWVGTPDSVVFLSEGAQKFQTAADHLKYVAKFAETPSGTLWMAETGRSVRPVPLAPKDSIRQDPEIIIGSQAITLDDQGSLWITSLGDGIRRVPDPAHLADSRMEKSDPTLEAFTQEKGLTGNFVYSILHDREGNIWIGTSVGLDRFRQSALVPLSFAPGSVITALAAGDQNSIWTAGLNRPLVRVEDGKIAPLQRFPLDNYIDCAYRDPEGVIWIGTHSQLVRFADERIHPINRLKERASYTQDHGEILDAGLTLRPVDLPKDHEIVLSPETRPRALTMDRSGRLWLSVSGKGVFRLDGPAWTSLESLGGPKGSAISEFTDNDGRVWFGFANNVIAVLDGNKVQTFSRKDGVSVGSVMSFQADGRSIWIGGDLGLALFDGSHFQLVVPADGNAFGGISGIMVVAEDGLWFPENRGVIHIPEAELRQFRSNPAYRVTFETFGLLDGLPAQLQRTHVLPSAIQSTDGLLWFATNQGLVWIDPKRISRNPIPPPVSIESIAANNKTYNLSPSLTLPARTQNLQIAYTGLSLSIPERVRFKYRLEGQDKDWQDVGTRREAFYTNIAPGTYRFHVIACNNDGVWNDEGATFSFRIAPAWYQTDWFLLLCGAIGLLMVWAIHRLRVRQIARALSARFDERLAERTRLARELHDTLLQTIQGSKMVADDALDQSTDMVHMRRAMERLSKWLGQATLEGRAALKSLRISTRERNNLAESLRHAAEDVADQSPMELSFSVTGEAREMHPIVRDEIYHIGCEAIRNAYTHSRGTRLEVELGYARGLLMRIRDNGVGMEESLADKGREGHFGLQGMRERAGRIGATLTIVSYAVTGTEITLSVPGNIVFTKPSETHGKNKRSSSEDQNL
jgi:signal transduction histidine kinase/ligand-binding sensor domain-containing protein